MLNTNKGKVFNNILKLADVTKNFPDFPRQAF